MTTLRLGIVRPDRPAAVVALAEARVLSHEFERRLGPTLLDLRVHGDPIGPWNPWANASWPAGIDVEIDPQSIWSADVPPLTALFGRTVEPAAAEVRRRMLAHLGLLPSVLDQATLEELSTLPMRPTDLWLMIGAAERVDVEDPAVAAFGADVGGDWHVSLDSMLDAAAAQIGEQESTAHTLERAVAAEAHWRRRAAGLADELARSEAEATTRLDQLAGEAAALSEQVERLRFDAESGP